MIPIRPQMHDTRQACTHGSTSRTRSEEGHRRCVFIHCYRSIHIVARTGFASGNRAEQPLIAHSVPRCRCQNILASFSKQRFNLHSE